LFLLLFKPFGLVTAGKQLVSYCLVYGFITFLVSLIFNALANQLIQKDQPTWVFWKWVVATLLLILCISFANYFYWLFITKNFQFNLRIFLIITLNTLLLGIFPLVFIGSILLIKSRQKNLNIAGGLSLPENIHHNNTVKLGDKTYQTDDILYIEAMQNYVVIHRKNLSKETIRSTLAKLANQLLAHHIIRCHRSYLVNINAIESVSGNAQGLKLHLTDTAQIIPVSRKYIPKIRAVLA